MLYLQKHHVVAVCSSRFIVLLDPDKPQNLQYSTRCGSALVNILWENGAWGWRKRPGFLLLREPERCLIFCFLNGELFICDPTLLLLGRDGIQLSQLVQTGSSGAWAWQQSWGSWIKTSDGHVALLCTACVVSVVWPLGKAEVYLHACGLCVYTAILQMPGRPALCW